MSNFLFSKQDFLGTAPPPVVRNGSAFPLSLRIYSGLRPYLGIIKSLAGVRGVKRKIMARFQRLGGAARFKVASVRKGRAIPHNRRRSRTRQRWFGCGSAALCDLCVPVLGGGIFGHSF